MGVSLKDGIAGMASCNRSRILRGLGRFTYKALNMQSIFRHIWTYDPRLKTTGFTVLILLLVEITNYRRRDEKVIRPQNQVLKSHWN